MTIILNLYILITDWYSNLQKIFIFFSQFFTSMETYKKTAAKYIRTYDIASGSRCACKKWSFFSIVAHNKMLENSWYCYAKIHVLIHPHIVIKLTLYTSFSFTLTLCGTFCSTFFSLREFHIKSQYKLLTNSVVVFMWMGRVLKKEHIHNYT